MFFVLQDKVLNFLKGVDVILDIGKNCLQLNVVEVKSVIIIFCAVNGVLTVFFALKRDAVSAELVLRV